MIDKFVMQGSQPTAVLDYSQLRDVDEDIIEFLKEGRVTPIYCSSRLSDEGVREVSSTYIQQRLKRLGEHGHVRNLYDTGLYELVEAPKREIVTDGGWPDGDPCPECDRLMDVGGVGNPGEQITWQQCDDCRIGWGQFTGFVDFDEDDVSIASFTIMSDDKQDNQR